MIDATFAAHVRLYLQAIAADHQPDGEGGCTAGDELEDGAPFERHLLDAIATGVEEPRSKPRRLKGRGKPTRPLPTERVATPASDDDPRPKGAKVTGAEYVGPTDCPDCGRGLTSRGGDLICPSLPLDLAIAGQGGIVACGVKRDG